MKNFDMQIQKYTELNNLQTQGDTQAEEKLDSPCTVIKFFLQRN